MTRARSAARLLATPIAAVVTLVLVYVLVGEQTDAIAVSSLSGAEGATTAHAFDGNVTTALLEHLRLVAVSAVVVLLLGIPLGILLTRTRSRIVRWIVNGSFSAGQAAPVIGVLVLLVGTATLATFVDGGGLGNIINDGISNQRDAVLLTGAILAAVFAVLIDWLAGLAERYLSPKGLRAEATS
jgi:osmoprotectant transport system permease protein